MSTYNQMKLPKINFSNFGVSLIINKRKILNLKKLKNKRMLLNLWSNKEFIWFHKRKMILLDQQSVMIRFYWYTYLLPNQNICQLF